MIKSISRHIIINVLKLKTDKILKAVRKKITQRGTSEEEKVKHHESGKRKG